MHIFVTRVKFILKNLKLFKSISQTFHKSLIIYTQTIKTWANISVSKKTITPKND